MEKEKTKIEKERKRKLAERIKEARLPFLLELAKWLIIDLMNRKNRKLHIYGIWCFVGIYGGGKTMSLVEYLEGMRRRHGDKILIATNFYYKGQDFPIMQWEDLLPEHDKPVIFAYDELQNEFNSREYRNFPVTLMHILTQNRKGHGKQIVYTTQVYSTVDKNFRDLTSHIVTCRTFWGRMTHTLRYERAYYEQLTSTINVDRKYKIRPVESHWYVQTDKLRNRYDSFMMLETAKNKIYNDRFLGQGVMVDKEMM